MSVRYPNLEAEMARAGLAPLSDEPQTNDGTTDELLGRKS